MLLLLEKIRSAIITALPGTCRPTRIVSPTTVPGNAMMIADLIFSSNKSILFLGAPGSGKTTIVREVARMLAQQTNVFVVDTSSEIAGPGDVPHECIGRARRMQVSSLNEQAR